MFFDKNLIESATLFIAFDCNHVLKIIYGIVRLVIAGRRNLEITVCSKGLNFLVMICPPIYPSNLELFFCFFW